LELLKVGMELARGIEPPTCGLQNLHALFMQPFEKDAEPRVNTGDGGSRSLPAFTGVYCHSLPLYPRIPLRGPLRFFAAKSEDALLAPNPAL